MLIWLAPFFGMKMAGWQFEQSRAKLCTTRLGGEVALGNPSAGIGQLVWNDVPLDGHILGVSAGEPGSAGEPSSPQDAFARGTDLVAVYAEPGPPSLAPLFSNRFRISGAVRFLLSVRISSKIATPPGAYIS